MSDETYRRGVCLFRKYGESLVIDNHIRFRPLHLLSIFEVGELEYELSPIEEYNSLDNVIKVEAGWAWLMTKHGWSAKCCDLMLRSVLDLAKEDYSCGGIQLTAYLGEDPGVPHMLSRLPIPKLVDTACVVELASEESEDESMMVKLYFDRPQEIYFAGLKAVMTLENFRGTNGAAIRIEAGQEHSIVREELLSDRKLRRRD